LTADLFFSAFGLYVRANRPIPGLRAVTAPRTADVRVRLGLRPPLPAATLNGRSQTRYVSNQESGGEPNLIVWELDDGRHFLLRYGDGTEFVVNRPGTEVWATWPDPLTVEDTATYLLGPVFGFVLRLRGTTCLHASAVAVGGRAVALVGPPGAGKSTTAAAFARRGYPLLADDVAALEDLGTSFRVQPANPRIRLWAASVAALYGAPEALPLLTPNWEKRYLDVGEHGYPFQQGPLPLAAVYLLDYRRAESHTPRVEAVSPPEGLMALTANTYTNYLLDKAMRAREFDLLGRLIARVPLRRAIPHTDPDRLSRLCDVILEDVQALAPSPPALACPKQG
jgi:hypothetical protein